MQLITTNESLAEWTQALEKFDTIAIDTEGDSLHCYFEKLCFESLGPESDELLKVVRKIR